MRMPRPSHTHTYALLLLYTVPSVLQWLKDKKTPKSRLTLPPPPMQRYLVRQVEDVSYFIAADATIAESRGKGKTHQKK